MAIKQNLGITLTVPDGRDATGVYVSVSGIETFISNDPYLLSDGETLMHPLPVFDAGGPSFIDKMGNAQTALAVTTVT